jgi:hypothetical protein
VCGISVKRVINIADNEAILLSNEGIVYSCDSDGDGCVINVFLLQTTVKYLLRAIMKMMLHSMRMYMIFHNKLLLVIVLQIEK